MTDTFATLNPDLLHLCLLRLGKYGGRAVARAGATCKHWRAVASTERLWRELCVKRWPSTAKLPRAPASYLDFYKQRTRSWFVAPTIQLRRLTLLIDGLFGRFGGDRCFSEVLSFADATPCLVQPYGMAGLGPAHGFEWSVPVLHELLQAYVEEASRLEERVDIDFDADILRDDGKIAQAGTFEVVDFQNSERGVDTFSWQSEALDLEQHAEITSRHHERWFYLHVECTDGKLQVCASKSHDEGYVDLVSVLALLDWNSGSP